MTTLGATRRRWLVRSATVIGLVVVVAGPMTAFGMQPNWLLLGLFIAALALAIWTLLDLGEAVSPARVAAPFTIERHPHDDPRVRQLVGLVQNSPYGGGHADELRRVLATLAGRPEPAATGQPLPLAEIDRDLTELEHR